MNFLRSSAITLLLVIIANPVFAQLKTAADLKKAILLEKNLRKKYDLLSNLTGYYLEKGYADSMQMTAKNSLVVAQKLKNDSLMAETYIDIGSSMNLKSDYETSLLFHLKGLRLAEQGDLPQTQIRALISICIIYEDLENYSEGLRYAQQALNILPKAKNIEYSSIFLNGHMAFLSVLSKKPQQAKSYLAKMTPAYQIMEKKDGPDPYTQGFNYWVKALVAEQLETTEKAETAYKLTVAHSRKHNMLSVLTESLLYYANFKMSYGDFIGAKQLAQEALPIANQANLPFAAAKAASIISKGYDRLNSPDSANTYYRLKDSIQGKIFDRQRINRFQDLAFTEQIHQQEAAQKAEELKVRRRHNLQYAAIAILLITLSVAFLIFSRKAAKYPKLIEYLGVIGLLILFEFINLLPHPFLGAFTHESPLLMLLLMVMIAALLVPLHHRLEGLLIKKVGKRKH